MDKYNGTIIEESLEDNRIINDFEIIGIRISNAENPADRWHLVNVLISGEDIKRL